MSTIAIFSADKPDMRTYLSKALDEYDPAFYPKEVQDYDPAEIADPESIQIVSSFTDSQWSSEVIAQFPNLRAIATQSTGYDHIDIDYCKEQGIAVYNVPAYGAVTVAEYTWSLLLALSRRVISCHQAVQDDHSFAQRGVPELRGFDVAGSTIAVIGVGKIGHNVISRAHAFGMQIRAYDLHPDESLTREYHLTWADSVADAVQSADIVTVHVPYNSHTHHLINAEIFEAMQPGAVFINTSRGEVVDTHALFDALQSGQIAQAALDVLEDETALETGAESEHTSLNNTLIADPRVLITPHNAFNTTQALERIYQATAESIRTVVAGDTDAEDARRVV